MFTPDKFLMQARCDLCGYEFTNFLYYSSGIGAKSGPWKPYDYWHEPYAYLRINKNPVVCTECSTLYTKQSAGLDYSLKPILAIVSACLLLTIGVGLLLKTQSAVILSAIISIAIAIMASRVYIKWFTERNRLKYADWIREIESFDNACPNCSATESAHPRRAPMPVLCPNCGMPHLFIKR